MTERDRVPYLPQIEKMPVTTPLSRSSSVEKVLFTQHFRLVPSLPQQITKYYTSLVVRVNIFLILSKRKLFLFWFRRIQESGRNEKFQNFHHI